MIRKDEEKLCHLKQNCAIISDILRHSLGIIKIIPQTVPHFLELSEIQNQGWYFDNGPILFFHTWFLLKKANIYL